MIQQDTDLLLIVSKGQWTGHEALMRSHTKDHHTILILEKNTVNTGKVKVLETIEIQGEKPKWLIPPDAH